MIRGLFRGSYILEITRSLQRLQLKRASTKTVIDNLLQRHDAFFERIRATADAAEKFLNGSIASPGSSDALGRTAAVILGQPELAGASIESVYAKVKANHLDLAAEFLDMVSEQGLENLFLFFDDYSEIDHDARSVMVAALEAFFNAPAYQRKSLKFPIRVAIYWGDNFGTRLVGNMVPEEVGTDPYSANFYRKKQPGIVVDEKFGDHVRAIFEARCDFFGLKLNGGLLASSTHEETKQLCAFLARIWAGTCAFWQDTCSIYIVGTLILVLKTFTPVAEGFLALNATIWCGARCSIIPMIPTLLIST